MPGRLTTLVKGTFCASADARLQAASEATLLQWLADFEDTSKSLKDIAIAYGVMVGGGGQGQQQSRHYDEFFGTGAGSFFPELAEQTKLDVVRGAFIQGLRASIYQRYEPPGNVVKRPSPKPVSLYWIAGGPAFEAYVADSVAEVHILLLTPDPTPDLAPPAVSESRDEAIWLVASPGRADAIRKRASYAYKAPEPMPAGLSIECQKVKSY